MPIVTLPQAKAQLNIDPADTSEDDELNQYIAGIGTAVEDYLHEVVEERTVTERLRLSGHSRFRLWQVPVVDLVSLTDRATGASFDTTGLDVDEDTGLVEVLSGSAPSGVFTATYTAGYVTVPINIVNGALVILQHVWETQRGVGSVRSGVVGQEENYDPRFSYSIPRKALEWLGSPRPVVA